ncbi:circadian clock protein PASD1 [Mesoplodon densirostris]|uniref:circadian clock protein PASD1 n=1 Tax=Mesoplodon densirostris TaxID=48708 RepID=UPI0028DC38A5|nr:circadian clock protein PASD1 [Mesoplodon densirostris]
MDTVDLALSSEEAKKYAENEPQLRYETEKLSEDSFDCEFYPNRTLITYAIIIVTLESICQFVYDVPWDAPDVSENKAKDSVRIFTALRAMLQSHGYPVKGGKAKTSQSAAALSQKKRGKVNPEASREKSNWIPSLPSYEEFNQVVLQSLDGFMIIVSTDGVIIFVTDNISSLLGHLPGDIMGKKLLSLLPDEEKNEVSQKIAVQLSLSNSEKHIDFCCHLKRGGAEHGSSPAYEYVKFILSIKDISSEPLVLFSSSFPNQSCESSATNLSLEDRFYLVGTVCILRTETLRDLFIVKESGEDVLLAPDSDEEHQPVDHRSVQGQRRSSRMEHLHAEPDAPASEGQVGGVEVDQYGSQEFVRVIKRKSVIHYDSSTSTSETIPELPATPSLLSFEFRREVGHMEQVDQMGEMEQVDEEEEVDEVDQVHQEDEETLSSQSVTTDITDESLCLPPSIIQYIIRRERKLRKKFWEHLGKMAQLLQSEIQSQSQVLEILKEELQEVQDSKLHMQPFTSRHIHSPDPQSLEPVPKKQRIEPMNRPFPDHREAKHFCGSCSSHCFQFPEELEEPCDASSQQPAQEVVQYMQQQERLQEQSEQHNVTVENPVLQILLPCEPGQLVAEQQLSSSSHGENPWGQEDRSHSFLPEDQQGPCLNPMLLVHNQSSEMISSTTIPQFQISSDPNLVTLRIPECFIQLQQQPQDPQHHAYLQVNSWPSSEQASLQDQVTWIQAPSTEAEVPDPTGLQTSQDHAEYEPGQIYYYIPVEESNLHE